MRSLVITQHPPEVFFKDEGGKSHGMDCTVTLAEAISDPVHLSISLYYANESRVEEQDQQILTLIGDSPVLTEGNKTITIKFRISKVSRRKDGQRFRVRIEGVKIIGENIEIDEDIQPVFTEPIVVLSKRKVPGYNEVPLKKKNNSKKRPAAAIEDDVAIELPAVISEVSVDRLMHSKVDKVMGTVDKVSMTLTKALNVMQQQNSRIAQLEAKIVSMANTLREPTPKRFRGSDDGFLDVDIAEFPISESSSVSDGKEGYGSFFNSKKYNNKGFAFGGSPALIATAVPAGALPPFSDLLTDEVPLDGYSLTTLNRQHSFDFAATFD